MSQMPQLLSVTLQEDRILFHGPDGTTEFPLAYQIHSRLIQTGELARLLCEHLREEAGSALPAPGTLLRLALPRAWGLVCLALPYTGLDKLGQPMHHLAWEVGINTQEQAEQYVYDFHEVAGTGETHVLAIRQNLAQFCRTFCDELGWRLMEIIPNGDEHAGFVLDLERARSHQEALAAERFTPGRRRGRLALVAVLALVVLGSGALVLSGPWRRTRDVARLPDARQATVSRADSLAARPSRPAPPPAGWGDLLTSLGAQEDRLPDFLVLEAEGLLVRGAPAQDLDLGDLPGRPVTAGPRGREARWLAFAQPLGGGAPEDSTRPAERYVLKSLSELTARLGPVPGRVILQRRRTDAAGPNTHWRFARGPTPGAPAGWEVTVFHTVAPPAPAPPATR